MFCSGSVEMAPKGASVGGWRTYAGPFQGHYWVPFGHILLSHSLYFICHILLFTMPVNKTHNILGTKIGHWISYVHTEFHHLTAINVSSDLLDGRFCEAYNTRMLIYYHTISCEYITKWPLSYLKG